MASISKGATRARHVAHRLPLPPGSVREPKCGGGIARAAAIGALAMALAACQSTETSYEGEQFSDETRALEKQLMAEAAALGTAQAVMSMPAAFDPTGAASLATIPAGLAAREAFRRSADERMAAQLARDEREFYRRYGMNPDGTPTGRKPQDR